MNNVLVTIKTPSKTQVVHVAGNRAITVARLAGNKNIRVSIAQKGPQGAPGEPGGGSDSAQLLQVIAGEIISGGKAVMINSDGKAYVFDINNENNYGKMCGIAKEGVTTGSLLNVFVTGIATEVGSGWSAGNVYYVSSTGFLTMTPPPAGIRKTIGVGVANDKVLLSGGFELITI